MLLFFLLFPIVYLLFFRSTGDGSNDVIVNMMMGAGAGAGAGPVAGTLAPAGAAPLVSPAMTIAGAFDSMMAKLNIIDKGPVGANTYASPIAQL